MGKNYPGLPAGEGSAVPHRSSSANRCAVLRFGSAHEDARAHGRTALNRGLFLSPCPPGELGCGCAMHLRHGTRVAAPRLAQGSSTRGPRPCEAGATALAGLAQRATRGLMIPGAMGNTPEAQNGRAIFWLSTRASGERRSTRRRSRQNRAPRLRPGQARNDGWELGSAAQERATQTVAAKARQ